MWALIDLTANNDENKTRAGTACAVILWLLRVIGVPVTPTKRNLV